MEIDKEFWATLFFTILNILILYFILKKLLFKPVTNYMENRTNKIKEALDMAEEAKKKVEALESENKKRLKEVKEEGILILDSYKKKAETEYNSIIDKAKEEAELLIKNTQSQLEAEKGMLLKSIKDDIAQLVLETSEKVLNEKLDEKTNKKLISDFLNDKGDN